LYANSAIQQLGEPGELIRMQSVAEGTTPDGIQLAAAPATTPIASTNGNPPTSVKPLPSPSKFRSAAGAPPKQPSQLNPSSNKHYRVIKSQVGRGKSHEEIMSFAYKLYTDHADELDDIMSAVQMALTERNRKAN
jgi:hypothetical protein